MPATTQSKKHKRMLNIQEDLAGQTCETFRQTSTVPGQRHRPAFSKRRSAGALPHGCLDPTSERHESQQLLHQNTAS